MGWDGDWTVVAMAWQMKKSLIIGGTVQGQEAYLAMCPPAGVVTDKKLETSSLDLPDS